MTKMYTTHRKGEKLTLVFGERVRLVNERELKALKAKNDSKRSR